MKSRDPDAPLIAGCFTFGFGSVLVFATSLWPFFVFEESYRLEVLGRCLLTGLLPATIVGVLLTRRFGLPGAGCLVGGLLTFSVFFFLRHWPFTFIQGRADSVQMDYPATWVWLIPVSVAIAAFSLAGLFLPKTEAPPR